MRNKKIGVIVLILLLIVSFFSYQWIRVNRRYERDLEAIKANRKVEAVLHQENIDPFTVYFYQPKDEPIVVDYVYEDEGYKLPSKSIAKQAFTEHQVIWHYQERNGEHLVVISKCLFDPSPFTMEDNLGSEFDEISFMFEGLEYTYYITTFDQADDYKLYINDIEITEWDKL